MPDDATVFQDAIPAVANLDPDLLRALRRAATDAAGDGVEFDVNSGWRSREHQQRLFDEAVAKYGSKAEAARWVAIPGTSAHESGDAVDLGPAAATAWLSGHGAAYGLCQIYTQRSLALRATPGRRRSRLPADVRRRHGGSQDASMIGSGLSNRRRYSCRLLTAEVPPLS